MTDKAMPEYRDCPMCQGHGAIHAHQEALDVSALKIDNMKIENDYTDHYKKGWNDALDKVANRLNTPIPVSRKALEKAKIALERTLIYARPDGVWINSRVKGSAMWGLQDASPGTIESFKESARLNEEALSAIEAALTHPAPKDTPEEALENARKEADQGKALDNDFLIVPRDAPPDVYDYIEKMVRRKRNGADIYKMAIELAAEGGKQ